MICVGIDWARTHHTVHVLDDHGKTRDEFAIPHSGDGFQQLHHRLATLETDPHQVRIGIESHDGPLMDWLHNQAYRVYPLNPKSAAQGRQFLRPSEAKDDPFDAYALARLVFLEVCRPSPPIPHGHPHQTLEDVLRFRESLVQAKSDLLRQLRGLLDTWAPALRSLCKDLNRRWQRELLRRWPLGQDLQAAHLNALHHFAKTHRLRPATRHRLAQARQQTPLPVLSSRRHVLGSQIRSLLQRLEQVLDQIAQVEQAMTALVRADDRAPLLASLPGAGPASQAALLVALSQAEARGDDWRSLAAYTGMAPVTKQSGSSRSVRHRRACDNVLRRLLTYHAFQTTRQPSCWAHHDYQRRRARGVSHQTALRAIERRWIKIAYAMWHQRTLYSEDHFRQAQKRHRPIAA